MILQKFALYLKMWYNLRANFLNNTQKAHSMYRVCFFAIKGALWD